MTIITSVLLLNIMAATYGSLPIAPTAQSATSDMPCQLPSGTSVWRNELKSTMSISVDATGTVKGYYETAVSSNGCSKDKKQPLVGSCNGYAITFSVNYKGCNSTAAWAGVIDKTSSDNPIIRTLWHLAIGQAPPTFTSVFAGSDCFVLDGKFPQGLADCSKPKK